MLVVIGTETVLHPQPERRFDLAELFALESRRTVQQFAEREEIERCHRLEHIDLMIKPNFNDPLQPMHHHVQVRAIIIRGRLFSTSPQASNSCRICLNHSS